MKYEKTGTEQDCPRTRRGFRLHPEVLEMVERRKASGEYETYSDFVEDAIVFYNGVLDADEILTLEFLFHISLCKVN